MAEWHVIALSYKKKKLAFFRLSAIELPTGETYLPIEQPLPGLRGDGRDPGTDRIALVEL